MYTAYFDNFIRDVEAQSRETLETTLPLDSGGEIIRTFDWRRQRKIPTTISYIATTALSTTMNAAESKSYFMIEGTDK
jgi:hypothetical protein